MDILIDALIVLFVAYIAACTTFFYDFCIGEPSQGKPKSGRILSLLGLWLHNKYTRIEGRHELQKQDLKDKDDLELYNYRRKNWYKALGMCPICVNPYIAFIVFFISMALCYGVYSYYLPFWWVVPCMVVSNTFFRILYTRYN